MTGTTRNHLTRNLPKCYFGDAPTLAAHENLGQLPSAVAVRRETSGGSCAAIHPPARQTAASGHSSPHGITVDSTELAKPAPADDAAAGGRGLLSPAGSDAGQETRSLVEAGGVQLPGAKHGAGVEADTGEMTGAGPSSAPVCPGLASIARHAAGLGSRAYAVAAQRIIRGQQLRAARIIFGRRSPA